MPSFAFAAAAAAIATSAGAAAPAVPDDIVVTGTAPLPADRPAGRTVTTVDRTAFADSATTVGDIVKLSPGVVVLQGNGARDMGVSIRGSNARNSFGARNIQVFEDGFPVTQPDGLARFDLADPHAYGGVDVVRGPSSARYGNYALGGAIDFRTRRGRDIGGAELGFDAGAFGYANLYGTLGGAGRGFEYSLFGSFVRGDGTTSHSGYSTATLNALVAYEVSPRDRLTLKLVHNRGEFELSTRLSLDQYRQNPYQRDCATLTPAAKTRGCGFISVLVDGRSGPRLDQSAAEGDLARDDRRTIAGLRYEHEFRADTSWRTQATYDSRVVYQPTNATPFRGTFYSYNLATDVTRVGALFGRRTTLSAGLFYNALDNRSFSFNKTPAGRNGFGAPTQTILGHIRNLGARAHADMEVTPTVTLVAGVGGERSRIDVTQTGYRYTAATTTIAVIPAARQFWNVASELALAWQPSAGLRIHGRVANGYGIPQAGSLFVTPAGVPGNNRDLRAQKNTGVDFGIEFDLDARLHAELTGYYEWFRNELISQSAGIGLLAYTANAPRSVHRGIEFGLGWRPLRRLPGLRLDQRQLQRSALHAFHRAPHSAVAGTGPRARPRRQRYPRRRSALR